MKNKIKSKLLAVGVAAASVALCGCSNTIVESFETTRPWYDGNGSYEMLGYSVNIYDTANGTDEENRVCIAEGGLVYSLAEQTRTDGSINYSQLDTIFYVTYNDNAEEYERGLTDRISSAVEFQTDSLITSSMQKKVELADREGVDNNSYTLNADYFGTHTATRTMTGYENAITETLTIPNSTYHDNEMMYYLARATAIPESASTNFFMTNIFDSFVGGSFVQYTMVASCDQNIVTVDVGDWVSEFGVESVTDDDGNTSYPVLSHSVSITINDTKHGPSFYVYYSDAPFVQGDKSHSKIPVKMFNYEYSGSQIVRVTEYVLTSCSFDGAYQTDR